MVVVHPLLHIFQLILIKSRPVSRWKVLLHRLAFLSENLVYFDQRLDDFPVRCLQQACKELDVEQDERHC